MGMSNTVKGHQASRRGGKKVYCVYSVYDTKTTLPVIIDGTAAECANVMGIKIASFYSALDRQKKGLLRGWEIFTRFLDGKNSGGGGRKIG